MAEPVVSIIVNNYNYGRFLAAAIDSALAQDYPACEVIVVDDGSTDDSRQVIARYGHEVCAVLKRNGGQGSAFNAGLAISRGRVVHFLDADDTLHPDAAARAVEALSDPSVCQFLAPLDLIDADGARTGAIFPDHELPSGDLKERALGYGPWAYQVVPTSGNFWARWYLEKVMPIPEERFLVGGDEYLSAIAALYGRLASDRRTIGCYRGHGANVYWRARLGVEDVADDAFYFERISALIAEHADRLGLAVDPSRWLDSDWRQQVRQVVLHRAGRRPGRPAPAQVLRAVWRDQTRPHRKAVLMPAVAAMLALPHWPSLALGLKLLGRR
ncbi:MAG TPA: glycosyltransferase [Candidatus Omnitrophota bacterium]|nr:glycosyltransferase [Candidatus Omnitrophota bacterium]